MKQHLKYTLWYIIGILNSTTAQEVSLQDLAERFTSLKATFSILEQRALEIQEENKVDAPADIPPETPQPKPKPRPTKKPKQSALGSPVAIIETVESVYGTMEIPFISITLPLLGTIELKLEYDMNTNKSVFKGTFDTKKEITVGPLRITAGEMRLTDDDILSIDASATLYNRTATITIQNVAPAVQDATQPTSFTIPDISLSVVCSKEPLIKTSIGSFAITKGELLIRHKEQSPLLTLQAALTINNLTAPLTLKVTRTSLDVEGSLEPLGAFHPIPSLQDISFTGAKTFIQHTNDQLTVTIQGTGRIFSMASSASLIMQKKKNINTLALKTDIIANLSLADLFPEMRTTVIQDLVFKNVTIYATNNVYEDTARSLSLKPGISLYGELAMDSSQELRLLNTLTGNTTQTVTIAGTLSANRNDIFLRATLPPLHFKDQRIQSATCSIEITGQPAFKAETLITFTPAPEQQPLTTSASIGFEGATVVLNGGVVGCWDNPFIITPGFKLCDITLILGIEPKMFFTTGLPSKVGLSGSFEVAQKIVRMAGVFDAQDASKMAFIGDLEGTVSFQDLVTLVLTLAQQATKGRNAVAHRAQQVLKKGIPLNAIPHIAFSNLVFKIAPATMTINNKTYYAGLGAEGTAEFLKYKAAMRCSIGYDGIIAQGQLSNINLGIVQITGVPSADGTNTGPLCSLAATLDQQHFIIQGRLKVPSLFDQESNIRISPLDGITFTMSTKLFSKFSASLDARSVGSLDNPNFTVAVTFLNELPQIIQEALNTELLKAQKELNALADSANEKLKQARQTVIQAINDSRQDITTARKNAQQKLQALSKEAAQLEKDIATLNNDIEGAKKRISMNFIFDGDNIILAAHITKWELELLSKKTTVALTKAAEESAQQIVNSALSLAQDIATGTLSLTEQHIQELLQPTINNLLREVGNITYKGGMFVANNLLNLMAITKVTYNGSLAELANGTLGELQITLMVSGTSKTYKLPFNLQKYAESSKYTAQVIVKDEIHQP